MPNYYHPEIETMPYEQLRELQNERLVKQVRHVWDNVPYYRKKMEEKGVTPEDIKSIAVPVLAHRIVINGSISTISEQKKIIENILNVTPLTTEDWKK